jgi:hypothetical protein
VDGLALDFPYEPPMRARLWESVRPSILAVIQRSSSSNLSFENNTFTVKVPYFSDSTTTSNFPPQNVRSSECKSLTAEDRSVRGPEAGRSWLWWLIDKFPCSLVLFLYFSPDSFQTFTD